MANERRLIVLDYNAVRDAFDEEFKETMELIRSGETHLDNLAEGFTEADRVLRKMPAVDAVEVVRCGNCRWFSRKRCCPIAASGLIKGGKPLPFPEDFCSYGEKWEVE